MKEAYEVLEIEIIAFDCEDIITSSTCPNETEPMIFDDGQLS